ncbi:TPA: hypothetical protein BOS_20884 [Bos taurus]|nr:TPA: hypothetical protein BOS_20884 [Bos taurus]
MESSAVLVFGAGRVDAAATFDLCVTQQSLAGAVTHGFQLSWLHHCAQEFSSYSLHRETICCGTRKFARGRERVASKRARGSGSGAGDHGAAGASSAGVKAALPLPPGSPRVSRGGCGRGRVRRV